MYFLMIRPQQRRQREVQQMQATLGSGAVIMTSSGIYGTVVDVDEEEDIIDLEIAEGVSIRVARAAVARVIAPAQADADEVEDVEEIDDVVDEVDHATDPAPKTDATPNPVIERKD
jgi:preprotein translocase subunit YajC